MSQSFTPPLKVTVYTDNLAKCEIRIAGADGVAHAIEVPPTGNVYQGLHHAAPGLEVFLNDLLAMHGIVAPEPPAPPAEAGAPSDE